MKQWFILFTICLAWSLMWIDFTAVNVALAQIASDLHTNLSTLQWVITAYTLCSASLMAIGGRLGDMYGHRRLFIIGTLIFVISSALAGIAENASLLILSRVGQGVGIALVVPITTALVYLTFSPKQRGMALGFLTGTTGVSMAIGPTVGGLLITYLNWRWVFYINVPIGLFAVFMAFWLMTETAAAARKKIRIDFPGIIILVAGLVSLLFALSEVSLWGLWSWQFWGLLITAALLLIAFVWIEARSREPLIHFALLSNKTLMGIISVRTCTQYVFFVFIFVVNLYLQNILGFSADQAGLLLLAATVVLGILSPFAGHLMNHWSLRLLISLSCFILACSLLLLIFASITYSMTLLILSLILFGAAYAIHFPTTNIAALQTTDTNQSALVTGMLFAMAFSGASAGITFSSTVLTNLSQYRVNQLLSIIGIHFNENQLSLIYNMASGAQATSQTFNLFPATLAKQVIFLAVNGFLFGFIGVLIICIVLALFAMIIALRTLKNLIIKKTGYILDV